MLPYQQKMQENNGKKSDVSGINISKLVHCVKGSV